MSSNICLKECIKIIENRQNDFLEEYLNGVDINLIFNSETNIYDITIKNNNFEAFNILLYTEYNYNHSSTKILKFFNLKQLKDLLNKGYKPSNNFINLIIKNKGNEVIPLLKLIFQYTNFNTKLILKFLKNHYLNKESLSQSELNTIINIENEKLNEFNNAKDGIKIILENENESILKYLIENGVNINFKYEYEATTDYEYGIYDENLDDKKCNTKLEIKTPLITLLEKENESWIKYLIEHGANVDCEHELYDFNCHFDYDGQQCCDFIRCNFKTPISISCEKGNESMIKYLIEHGANINIDCSEEKVKEKLPNLQYITVKDKNNCYFSFAYDKENIEIFDNTYSPLSIACKNENESLVKYLIKQGANVNGINNNVDKPLFFACEKQNETIVKILIEHGANVNVEGKQYIDRYSLLKIYTPLSIACEKGNESIVKILIEHGANVNVEGINFEEICIPSIKNILVEHGANINC
ncbi:ankyrin [Anaeromyces robustus]|uniref:Ankyrin n=1 Tax=Anaeromyces robustus TaxID=1754192 RepID=A0A1Y1WQI8_9FUNG|nr:ankyrin [Anaeromyces robustus]|eukprot:ORX75655.1 ankyrin [Anaeromyces robustus]